MSTRLERYVWITIAVVALLAGALAALPTVAEAQADAQEEDTSGATRQADQSIYESTDPGAGHLVVEPGDSLWAIAQGLLGPHATPQQVANEVERIYWLNRDRIGDNPNLLPVGQELSLAQASGSTGDTTQTEPVVVAGPPVAGADEQPAAQEQPAEPGRGVDDTGGLKQEDASTAEESSGPEPYNAQHQQRRLLGLGVLALTFLLAVLAALRLPIKRGVGRPQPRVASPAYADRQASGVGPPGAALDVTNGRKQIFRRRAPGTKRLPPRKMGAAHAYSPQVRRSLRRAEGLESGGKAAGKSHPGALVVGLALSLAVLTGLPHTAEAQDAASGYHAPTADQTAHATTAQPETQDRLVVHPGDSLWSISQERLGPSASPGQIADEVRRTFELNRERIGDDPNLILAGQELLLTRGSEPAAVTGPATEFATTTAEEPTAPSEQPMVAGTTPGQKDEPTPEPLTPEPAQDQPVESQVSATDVEPSRSDLPYANRRQPDTLTVLLSAGLFLFTLAVAVFGIAKLRRTRRSLRERYQPAVRHDGVRGPGNEAGSTDPEQTLGAPGDRAPAKASGVGPPGAALDVTNRRKQIFRRRAPGTKRLPPRKMGAAHAYSPQVRRSLRRAEGLESGGKAAGKSHPGALVVGLALSLAVLTGLPHTAEAQDAASGYHAPTADQTAHATTAQPETQDRLVVHPGDSLWSISQERLGPSASPGQIADEVRRTFELNRERIGDDPNLILAGQELTLSGEASEPVLAETVNNEPIVLETAASDTEPASEPAAAGPPLETSAEATGEPGTLPESPEADAELVATFVEEPPAAGPERVAGDTRRKVGYAILLVTFAGALLGTSVLLGKERQ